MDKDTFLADYPEFTGIDESILNRTIERAITMIDESVWGGLSNCAIGLIAAHDIQIARLQFLEEQQIAAGLQTGKAPGGAKHIDYWDKSHYGQKYKELRKRLPRSGFAY